MTKKKLHENAKVQWFNKKFERNMIGKIVKFYNNSALVDISIMKDYQQLDLGDLTVVAKERLTVMTGE